MITVSINAQVFYVDGADVVVTQGAVMQVNGGLQNANLGDLEVQKVGVLIGQLIITGDFTNDATSGGDGTFQVEGDWINNSIFNSGVGDVVLDGVNQNISGTQSTSFYNLEITGTGIKTQTINQTVTNVLALNDRELATDLFTMFVTSSSITAITRTTGFVSSLDGGVLSRNTSLSSSYLFPVGSSIGTTRYRPIEIMPSSTNSNTYTVRMANVDATTEGYNRSLLDTGICMANSTFYHQINRTAGVDAIELTMYYDEIADGLWENMGYWTTLPSLWKKASNTIHTLGAPFNNVQASNWNNFSNEPYILIVPGISIDLGPDQTVCVGDTAYLDAGSGFTSYLWSTTETTQIIAVVTTGTYYVTVTDGYCSSVDSINVTIQNYSDATILPVGPYCDNDIPTNLIAADPGGIWTGTGVNATGLFTPSSAGAGTHQIIYTITGNCGDADTIDILIYDSPKAIMGSTSESCNGAEDGTARIDSLYGGTQPYTILWTNIGGTGTIPNDTTFIYPVAPGSYTVVISDSNGCTLNTSVIVDGSLEDCYTPDIYIPNIFSPNGDGNNDILYVYGHGITVFDFKIYDRWGEKIFESKTQTNGWDGTYRNTKLDPAVFVYYFKAELNNGETIKLTGNITLTK